MQLQEGTKVLRSNLSVKLVKRLEVKGCVSVKRSPVGTTQAASSD
jgi:hypothetical protein